MQRRLVFGILAGLCLIYLVLGWLYATRNPAWQVPDEPAHYNYIRQLVEDKRIPVIEVGDWDTDYQDLLVSSGFNPQNTGDIERVEYEDHQPPLYYLLAVPLYALTDGDLTTLRLFSVLIGLGVVLSAFRGVDVIFPEQPWLALSTAGFVAFVPQHVMMLSGINNDPLAEFIVGLALLVAVWYLKQDSPRYRDAALLGLLVGVAFLTKTTIYFLAGVSGVAVLLMWRRMRWSWTAALQHIAAFLIPALLLGGVWWSRNLDVYGGTDFLGLQRHDEVAGDQLQTDDYIQRDLGGDTGLYRKNYLYSTFHSFWGQFGWMAVPMPTRIYRLLLLITIAAFVGGPLYLWQQHFTPTQRDSLLLFGLAAGLVLAAYFTYNLTFVQFQGRYLFPALIPIGLWFALGLTGWATLVTNRLPLLRWSAVPMTLLLAFLAWYALNAYIVEYLPKWE